MAVSVLCLFLTVPWIGLQSVIVTFPGNTHLLLECYPVAKPQGKISQNNDQIMTQEDPGAH